MRHELLSRYLASTPAGCDAVISALGHNLTLRGMYGAPRKLCTDTVSQLCRVAETLQPSRPIRLIAISTEGVDRPAARPRRAAGAVAAVAALAAARGQHGRRRLSPPLGAHERSRRVLRRAAERHDRLTLTLTLTLNLTLTLTLTLTRCGRAT